MISYLVESLVRTSGVAETPGELLVGPSTLVPKTFEKLEHSFSRHREMFTFYGCGYALGIQHNDKTLAISLSKSIPEFWPES